ncbi:MAG: HlyC/CorC family transporter [Verrucomicrobia bacterium]|nr:HlyC/CorC family transporter [Verrucomicrobiota bacterium]
MSLTQWLVPAGLVACAGASFFFALAESALFALGKWQVSQLAEESPKRGGAVARLLQTPSELLATLVLGNTLTNGMIVALGLHQALTGRWQLGLTVAGLLVLVLVVCEVWPKTLAVREPKRWAARVAPVMLWLQRLARPLHRLVEWMNTLLLQGVLRRALKPVAARAEEEYRELLELAFQQGALAQGEKEIIAEIISLDQKTAGRVMTPISRTHCISDDLSIEDMIAAARRYRNRRLPIFDGTTDTIVGVLDTKVLLLDPQVDLADAIEFPSFVPESMNVLQLMKALQRQQRGMAIVLNEFGGTAGVVTMQDILEEMIGDIPGEPEAPGFVMEKLGEGRWRVSGTMRLDDFRREYPDLGEGPGIDTMGGLMVALCEVVPAAGEAVVYRGLKLTAHVADERRVKEVLVESLRKK